MKEKNLQRLNIAPFVYNNCYLYVQWRGVAHLAHQLLPFLSRLSADADMVLAKMDSEQWGWCACHVSCNHNSSLYLLYYEFWTTCGSWTWRRASSAAHHEWENQQQLSKFDRLSGWWQHVKSDVSACCRAKRALSLKVVPLTYFSLLR